MTPALSFTSLKAETNSRNGGFDVGWTMISMPPFNLMEISSRKYIAKIWKVKEKSQEASLELVIYIQTMKSNFKKSIEGITIILWEAFDKNGIGGRHSEVKCVAKWKIFFQCSL